MRDNRESTGIPVPSVWQMLVVAAAICAGWLIWSEFRGQSRDTIVAVNPVVDAAEAGLNTLRSIEALGERGPDGVPELIKALGDANPKARRYALLALRRLGPQAGEALGPIHDRLSDEDAVVREYAIDVYLHIRRDADAVVRAIVESLGDEEERVRDAAAKVLLQIGPPAIPRVVEMLECESAAARVTTLMVLRRIGWERSHSELEDAVRKLTGDEDRELRAAALLTLVRWGQPQSGEIRDLLAQPVRKTIATPGPEGDLGSQETALGAIIRLGPDAAENLPDVLALLDQKPDRWYMQPRLALEALRSMKAAALPAAPQLLKLFDESTGGYRLDIGWTLVEIGADRQDVVDRLVPLILGTETEVWRLAGRLLAYASPEEGRRQVAALVPQLSFEQIAQQRYPPALHAVSGLAHVAQEAIPALTELLQRPLDDWSFQVAAAALGEMGPDAAPAVPILIRLLARDLSTLKLAQRRAVLASLGAMGSAARLAIPAILSELKSLKLDPSSTPDEKREREHCLATAIRVLELVGGADPNVLAALQMQLLGGNARAGNVALDALLELSPESPDLLPELLKRHWILAISRLTCDRHNAIGPLTEALRGTEPRARKAAAWVLGTLGPDATTALPALYEALSDWQNSLYEPRWAIYAPPDNGNRNEIFGGGASQRIWQSTFVPPFDEGQQFERSSVRDLVREAILKIDPQADFRDNGESNVESRQRQETDETRIRTGIRKIRV